MVGNSRERHVVVVANGEFQYSSRLLPIVDQADVIVAADGGSNWLASHDRLPDVLVGDLDSVTPELLEALQRGNCRVLRHSPRKDETDTELALLEAVALGATRITVLGGLGDRIDHTLANVSLLLMPELADIYAVIFDGVSYLSLVRHQAIVQGAAGDVVSLIPMGSDAEGIVTEGLEYPLRDESLPLGRARGVSNVLLGSSARVTLRRGSLLVIHTPKRHLSDQRQGHSP